MSNPKVSVIIPVYKAENYLGKCLNGFLNQTLLDVEVILVDDGSPDNSGQICERYSNIDSRFKTYHKNNGGVSSARQYGLERATGEYIIHADPDDWAEPDMLENLYNEAVRSSSDMVICDFYKNSKAGQTYEIQRPKALDCDSVIYSIYNGLYGACWNKLIRRETIVKYKVSFPEGWSLAEDQYFIVSLLLNNVKVSYLNKAFYHYVIGENENSLANVVRRTYEYDKMMYSAFINLSRNNSNNKLIKSENALVIIKNEFERHNSTSSSFAKKCIPYMLYMMQSHATVKLKTMLTLSCLGLYEMIYSIWKSHTV